MEILEDFVSLVLITLYHAYVFGRIVARRVRSRRWPSAPAIVEKLGTEIDEEVTELGKVIANRTITTAYRYTVDGRAWRGSGVGVFDGLLVLNNYCDTLYRRIQQARDSGEPLTIRYHPRRPGEALITRDIYSRAFFFLGASGLVFAALSAVSLLRVEDVQFRLTSMLTLVVFVVLVVVERVRDRTR